MRKIIFLSSFILMLLSIACKPTESKKTLEDGLYLVTKIDTIEGQNSPLSANEKAIFFSKMFDEYNGDEYTRIIVNSNEYIPLELEISPTTEQETEQKKKLLLSLTKEASEKLKDFTTKHLMQRVVLVVDGEALTMHKIKEAITAGKLQISRCNDNACELLSVKLKDNVKE